MYMCMCMHMNMNMTCEFLILSDIEEAEGRVIAVSEGAYLVDAFNFLREAASVYEKPHACRIQGVAT